MSEVRRGKGADFDEVSTILHHRFDPTVPQAAFLLRVIEGEDLGASARIDGNEPTRFLVGQSPVCALRLRDRQVSRRHCALEVTGDRLRVTDVESTNGTFLGALRVYDIALLGGEQLRLGTTVIQVDRLAGAARSGPGAAATPPPVTATSFGRLIGASHEMRRLYPLCERLAAADIPVVIEGETGTGKEVLTESLHDRSRRASAPFVVFDCTAVAPSLVESELFGHERGAFTGALSARRGVFEQAHGGTLFIDEIGDLELSLQPKLLRALERGEIRRVGGEKMIKVDVRVVAATRRDLDHEVQERRFRDDLFHRLAVARIELPPLRKRRGDVATLAQHFCVEMGADPHRLGAALLRRWEDYAWPGNVRELRNAVARHLALGDLAALGLKDAGASVPAAAAAAASGDFFEQVLARELPLPAARQQVVDELEQRYVARVLAANGGNVTNAARASGLGRRYFQQLKEKIGSSGK